ncbi:MAG: DNA double-strand break repair nuclease NurA, partial [Chloroflexi bacterium]|nr:DNA double-strand break repair nuclease NurA [Chloroflexota bacterium]
MALDLGKTVLQIERMTDDLRAQQSGKLQRLDRALEVVNDFDTEAYEEKRARSAQTLAWPAAPVVSEPPSTRHSAPASLPDDFCVVAVDGSHIDVDRHIPARCFLINIGTCILTYGSQPDAILTSEPHLYAQDDELVIRDQSAKRRQQYIQGGVLGAKRAVEEIRGLVDAVRSLPSDTPTLALMDGTLVMFLDRGLQDFVVDELLKNGFVTALDELRSLAQDRPLAVASYVSLPGASEFMGAVRVSACPYEVSDCAVHCGHLPPGGRPCDDAAEGILDREVFSKLLERGQRSAVFHSTSSLVANYYEGHGISFLYI